MFLKSSSVTQELKLELSKGQANIAALGQAADVIASGLTIEGATVVKAKVAELKTSAISISDAINQKANLLAEMSIARFVTYCYSITSNCVDTIF